jgi:hypothetical protein
MFLSVGCPKVIWCCTELAVELSMDLYSYIGYEIIDLEMFKGQPWSLSSDIY